MVAPPVNEMGSRETGKLTPRIGLAGDWVIGAANSGPALSLSVTLAAIVAATAYGSGPVILLCAVPMLIIANAYRRLNSWNANCGAAFTWVGRTMSPYLGWLTGWLMIMANLIGNVAAVTVLAPSVLAVAGQNQNARWPNIIIDTIVGVLMIAIAVIGIKLSVRTQIVLAVVEYGIVIALAIAATVFWAGHSAGSYQPSAGWLSLSGIGGKGSLSAGLLFAVFMFVGWDGSANVNEETHRPSVNPGKAVLLAVLFLAIFYALCTMGLQGAVSPHALQANAAAPLVYIGQILGGTWFGRAAGLAVALSVIAGTGTGFVVLGRIGFGMSSSGALPGSLGNLSPRFGTPVLATIIPGAVFVVVTWVYLLVGSVASAFTALVAGTGILFTSYYILTGLALIAYYRRRVFSSPVSAVMLGLLPVAAVVFLGWIIWKTMAANAANVNWTIAGIVVLGIVIMVAVRMTSSGARYFSTKREALQTARGRRH
ncbi:MAG TPA: APC family permease [Streptosporangiaceae bacterium]|nr:APC family permease [Streptosporangiaceae bacterium]